MSTEKLVFKKKGSIDLFIEWIDRFKGEISKDSLIIEIDVLQKMFVSKTFSRDRSLVRFSQISFETAGLDLTKVPEAFPQDKRVLVGIFMTLPKLIDVLKQFSTAEVFSMEIDYSDAVIGEKKIPSLCANIVQFKSKTLKMKIVCSSLNAVEMTPLEDKTFNEVVWQAPDPISIQLSGELIKNLVDISNIFVSQEKLKNFMQFYTTTEEGQRILKVCDPEQQSYDYTLGVVENGDYADIELPIYRDRFLLAVKNAYSDTTLTISTSSPNRVLVQLGNGDTKTIVAKVNRVSESI